MFSSICGILFCKFKLTWALPTSYLKTLSSVICVYIELSVLHCFTVINSRSQFLGGNRSGREVVTYKRAEARQRDLLWVVRRPYIHRRRRRDFGGRLKDREDMREWGKKKKTESLHSIFCGEGLPTIIIRTYDLMLISVFFVFLFSNQL